MDAELLERIAESAYTRAGFSTTHARSPLRLAHVLIGQGREHVVYDVDDIDEPASLWTSPCGHEALLLREGISRAAAWWFGARELARWILKRRGFDPAPANVDYLAACLRAPRTAVAELASHSGPTFCDLAGAFRISESAAVLRYAEVSGTPLVLFAPNRPTRIRGQKRRGLKYCRVELSDAPERVALLAG